MISGCACTPRTALALALQAVCAVERFVTEALSVDHARVEIVKCRARLSYTYRTPRVIEVDVRPSRARLSLSIRLDQSAAPRVHKGACTQQGPLRLSAPHGDGSGRRAQEGVRPFSADLSAAQLSPPAQQRTMNKSGTYTWSSALVRTTGRRRADMPHG